MTSNRTMCRPAVIESAPNLTVWRCVKCEFEGRERYQFSELQIHRQCDSDIPDERLPGWRLRTLLHEVVGEVDGCQCERLARQMDLHGLGWCKANVAEIVGWLRDEAERKQMTFTETGVTWIVRLALTLAEEMREPTRAERVTLRAMRLGNTIVNSRKENRLQASSGPDTRQ